MARQIVGGRIGLILVTFALLGSTCPHRRPAKLADVLIDAHQENRSIPLLSSQYPELDLAGAYRVQKAYVLKRLEGDQIAGFKAGLTSRGSQQRFGVDSPLGGVLLSSGRHSDEAMIDGAMFQQPMIETEIGFVLGQAITRPLGEVPELHEKIRAVAPVIELPDLGFADMEHLKAVDIVAANVSAFQFIVGRKRGLEGMDLNNINAVLRLEGEEVNRGEGRDAMGDQWRAALWLVNTMVELGWRMEPGQIIITGALGNMIPGKPGAYVADFGALGQISFVIE